MRHDFCPAYSRVRIVPQPFPVGADPYHCYDYDYMRRIATD